MSNIIKKSFFTFLFSLFFLNFVFSQLQPGFKRPVILARAEDKSEILGKIARYAWAKEAFEGIKASAEPYADRHQVDPEWILSRWPMYREEGKRYTRFWTSFPNLNRSRSRGNAPVPTVRPDAAWRSQSGYPGIDQMVAYPSHQPGLWLTKANTGGKVQHWDNRIKWSRYCRPLYGLAVNSGMLYWLTGEEKYAKLAADVFMQWIRGASYMNRPTIGNFWLSRSWGFFSFQTIDEDSHAMFQAYDFIYDYLMEHNDEYYYDKRYVDSVTKVYPSTGPNVSDFPGRDMRYLDANSNESIELMVDAFAYKFGWEFVRNGGGGNWEQVETAYLATCAFAISDKNKADRLKLVDYLLNKSYYRTPNAPPGTDYTQGRQQHILKMMKNYNARGLNKEPISYHNYPMSRLMPSVIMLDNAGYAIMSDPRYNKLFKATYVLTEYSFPHGYTTSFGHGGAGAQAPTFLEVSYKYAKKYNSPEKDRIAYELNKRINNGYTREGTTALLSYEPVIEKPSIAKIEKSRSDYIDFAKHYIQRNGDNELEGLMYSIGADGNYGHAGENTGLTVELYGKGFILAPDSGYGGWSSARFNQYTKKEGSHNTVVVNDEKQRGGRSANKAANLITMDPPLGSIIGVSDDNSFSLASYRYNGSKQARSILMNRTAKNSGYYLDVFWSEGNKTDYHYHNVSSGVPNVAFRQNGAIRTGSSTTRFRKSSLGQHWFSERKEYDITAGDVQVVSKVDLNNFAKNVYMKAWVLGDSDRSYYSARTPYAGGSQRAFQKYGHSNSVMIIRDSRPNYNSKPFVVLYEPYKGDGRSVIDQVRRMNGTKNQSHYVGVVVSNSDRNGQDRADVQYLISSKANNVAFNHEGIQFKGYSATASHNDGELSSLYLGKGSYLANCGYRLEKVGNGDITAYLEIEEKAMTLVSQDDVRVTMIYRNDNRAIAYKNLGLYYKYKGSSEIRSATEQSAVPNDGVTAEGYGTIIANIPDTDEREVLLLPLEKKDYSGVNAKPEVKVYHNGTISKHRVLFDDDSEISLLINSPTGFYPESLLIKKGRQTLSRSEYEIESRSFAESKVHLRNVSDLDSGLYKVSFIVPGDGYTRKEYNVSLVRTTSSTRLVKVYPNPYKYGEHDYLKIEYFIPKNANKSKYILLLVNILGDEMDSVSMTSMLDNTGTAHWNTFMLRKNYKPGLYMIALTDKKKRKVYDRKYILVEK